MRSAITSLAILLCLSVFACSKPESKLVGTWINEKTSSSMEFNSDKTGVIHQRTHADIPADLAFKWTMLGSETPPTGVGGFFNVTSNDAACALRAATTSPDRSLVFYMAK